jgi:peptidoglycan/LPS O-acetylase OafA/YrhL
MFKSKIRQKECGASSLPGGSATEVVGLDTIRFLAAMCVAFGHGALFPVVAYVPKKAGIWAAIIGLNNSAFNGVAAVLIFFVISGFCIHYSYARGQPFLLMPFLARRLIRIALPAAVSIALANSLGAEAQGALGAVLWSLYYEMIYYVMYPALRMLFLSIAILPCIACSIIVSAVLIAPHWDIAYYQDFPIIYGCLIPLPAWLLGCLLADRVANRKFGRDAHKIWAWRLVGLSYAAFVQAYFFKGPIKVGMPALLFPFTIYSFFWLEREITRARQVGAKAVLEWAGKWSYSIYLMHGIALVTLKPKYPAAPALLWAITLIAILGASYCFYLIVEWPSHQFARSVAYRISKKVRL